jgi:hypothetical protein
MNEDKLMERLRRIEALEDRWGKGCRRSGQAAHSGKAPDRRAGGSPG